jgi:C1A family cysteine protease
MTNDEHEALWESVRAAGANWRPGHNAVTDLAPDDRRQRLGYVPGPDDPSLEARETMALARIIAHDVTALAAAPAKIDWRSKDGSNYVNSIKDQGNCGSCVAFGTAAAMESRARISRSLPVNAPGGSALPDLSEAHLFYCGNTIADPCRNGWWPTAALAFATSTGLVPASCFPYTPANQPCKPCDNWQSMLTKIATSRTLTNIADMKQCLLAAGPLITCFTVYEDFWAYTGGVYQHTSGANEGGHCVACVGFDDTKHAWLCKNSWGTGWGEGGFFWIGYGQCGIDASMWTVDTFSQIYTLPRRRAAAH